MEGISYQSFINGEKMKSNILLILSVIVTVICSGCASADVLMLDESKEYDPTNNVLLLFDEPSKEFIIIAIIEGHGSQYNTDSQVLKSIRKSAKKIGAHAIIPLATDKEYVPPTTHANPVAGSPPITIAGGNKITTRAAAIRFVDE